MLPFQNMTVRSAGDLLADLTTCRSFRHIKGEDRAAAVEAAFMPKVAAYYSPLHKAMGYVCEDCGKPKSDLSGPNGKCQACYRNNTKKEWVFATDTFASIMKARGYSCDTCSTVTEVSDEMATAAATRALENMSGQIKPMLCKKCSQDFTVHCTRNHQRDARAVNSPDHDKMYLGYIALQVSRAGWKVWNNQYLRQRA